MEQIHFHLTGSDDLDSCSAPHCLSHQKCALSVLEMVRDGDRWGGGRREGGGGGGRMLLTASLTRTEFE